MPRQQDSANDSDLYGFTEKMPLEKCGKLGAAAAAEVIGHIGPRPQMAYRDLIKKAA